MSVYRCGSCGHIAEDVVRLPNSKIPCAKCQVPATLFATPFFVGKLVERYLAARRELEVLKHQEDEVEAGESAVAAVIPAFVDVDFQNSEVLATDVQHQPLREWFLTKKIQSSFDISLVDTTGFFDEAAKAIGDEYGLMADVIEQVRFAYRKDWSWINVDLGKKTPPEAQRVRSILRDLYSNTFFARYSFQKQKNVIGLALQPAQTVKRFFEGGWLEWYAFMQTLSLCVERKVDFSCARSVKLEFPNEDLRELDVVFLLRKRFPIIIECKSGEFRTDIEKYTKLRSRLGLDRSQVVICNPDLTDEQIKGLTTMYELTFSNLSSLRTHLSALM